MLYIYGNSRITEYQRLTTYGFDPRDKPSDGYTKDEAYDLRLTNYGLRLTALGTVFPDVIRIEGDLMTRVLRGVAPPRHPLSNSHYLYRLCNN